jgi:hypothetical protein
MVIIMRTRSLARKLVVALAATAFAATWLLSAAASAPSAPEEFDAAAAYKEMKCGMCHSPKAERSFDPSKTDEVLVQAILKGATGAKPPNMPAYEAKGIDEAKAKAFVAYMKQLRQP